MPLKDTQHVTGLAELSRQLERLQDKAAAKALRGASTSAMLPVLRQAQNNIPVGDVAHKTYKGRLVAPGFAKRSIVRRTKLSRSKTSVSTSVGVRREAFYAVNFVELGTSTQPPRPWLVPAYNATYREVIRRFSKELKRRILRAAK